MADFPIFITGFQTGDFFDCLLIAQSQRAAPVAPSPNGQPPGPGWPSAGSLLAMSWIANSKSSYVRTNIDQYQPNMVLLNIIIIKYF